MAIAVRIEEQPVETFSSLGKSTGKILGQVGDASAETVLYTVPSLTTTQITTIWATNRDKKSGELRIGISVNGGVLAVEDYIYFDFSIASSQTLTSDVGRGIFISAGDEIRVFSSSALITFGATGLEFV